MVRDVFDGKQLANLVGSLGVGHGKDKTFCINGWIFGADNLLTN